MGDEIGEIVLELADVGDVAARTRRAMAARVDGDGDEAGVRQRQRGRIHLVGGGRRAMIDDRQMIASAVSGGIEAIGEPRAVARLEAAEGRLAVLRDRHRAGMNRFERRRRLDRLRQHRPERQRRNADRRQRPQRNLPQTHARLQFQSTLCNRVIIRDQPEASFSPCDKMRNSPCGPVRIASVLQQRGIHSSIANAEEEPNAAGPVPSAFRLFFVLAAFDRGGAGAARFAAGAGLRHRAEKMRRGKWPPRSRARAVAAPSALSATKPSAGASRAPPAPPLSGRRPRRRQAHRR